VKKTFDSQAYIDLAEKTFRKYANAENAAGAKAYMRDQFDYFGLSTPVRRDVQKTFHAQNELPPFEALESLVKKCWKKDERELQYFVMELCEKYKKQFTKEDIPLFEFMITNKSWWDTVDFIAPKLVAALFLTHPELAAPTTARWIKSKNIWLMRAALIYQNLYKKKTNEELLFKLIRQSSDHPDFFIRKGIGWALRQYARTNPAAVKKFVKENTLSPLSAQQAMKHL